MVVWSSFFLTGVLFYAFALFVSPPAEGRKALHKHFIAGTWTHKSAITDLMVYTIGKFTGLLHAWAMPIITLFIATIIAGGIHDIFPAQLSLHSTIPIFLCCALVLMLFSDFSGWLSHVAQHYVPVLWELHKVHHSATFLNPLTARRGHTLGILFDDTAHACIMGLPTGVIIALFKFNPVEITFLGVVVNKLFFVLTLETLQHSHYPITFGIFERVFISPQMHQIHHSSKKEHWDKNFGYIFSLWDWIFRTVYIPHRGEDIVYGIGDRETGAYQGLYGVYVLPLIGMWRVVTRKTYNAPATRNRAFSPAGILWRESPTTPQSSMDLNAIELSQAKAEV